MLEGFTNQYQLSKTLRFELKPIGNTLEYIEQKGLLSQDEQRAENYTVIKEVIDTYHKAFIEQSLANVVFDNLERFEELYLKSNKDEKEQKEFEKLQENLRKEIVKNFKAHPRWSNLFKKELIKEDLLAFDQITDEQKAIAEVLSSLDDKIDLLHRQNRTLEELAQTLFRQWFIEEAKEEWEEIKLGDFVDCITGYSYKSDDLNDSKNALVTLKNFERFDEKDFMFVLSKAEFEHLRSQIGTTNFSKTRAMTFALFTDKHVTGFTK